MNFKPGDKVKILPNFNTDSIYGSYISTKEVGKVYTVKSTEENYKYQGRKVVRVHFEETPYIWAEPHELSYITKLEKILA